MVRQNRTGAAWTLRKDDQSVQQGVWRQTTRRQIMCCKKREKRIKGAEKAKHAKRQAIGSLPGSFQVFSFLYWPSCLGDETHLNIG
mmetsp:Transcript_29577/g.58015  ORF Transcript_29577/g.58015 Transcript_29577/m.58015 type:complete len:86 (-) Transcript_29577:148-405(-)